MADKHFVVQGAVCKCQYGASPDKLKVSGTDREYINDDGAEKLIGSSIDLGQPFEAKTFGSCTVTRSSCSPAVTQWQDFYKNVTLTNGGKILTEDSKAICSVGGSPCISFTTHGQTAEVTAGQMAKVDQGPISVLNPMAAKPAPGKELPKIKQIQEDIATRKSPLTEKSAEGKGKVPVVKMSVNEKAIFKVLSYYNSAKADKRKVSWKILNGHSFDSAGDTFMDRGEQLEYTFDKPGDYRILAFGNEATQNDDHCCIDVTVMVNKLKDSFDGDDAATRVVKGGGSRLRKGVPVTLKAGYELDPTPEDKQKVTMRVTDASGTILAGPTAPGTDEISFTAPNSGGTYKVVAVMTASDDAAEQTVTQDFTSENNSVTKIKPGPAIVRPGTAMSFSVEGMTYGGSPTTEEAGQIKWQLNGRNIDTGSSIQISPDQLKDEGEYVVEAYVSQANAWNAKAGKPAAHAADDWHFKVEKNKILSLAEEKGKTQWIVGKTYKIMATMTMPYDARQDGPITWVPAGGTAEHTFVRAAKPGKLYTAATMGGVTVRLDITAAYAEIERWCFTDASDNYKHQAGWSEQVNAVIVSKLAANATVGIHLLEGNRYTSPSYLKDLGKVTFNAEGIAKVSFNTNDIQQQLKALYFEGGVYDLFFAVQKEDSGIQFAETKTFTANGKTFVYPQKESVQTGKETGKYLYIDGKPDIVDVKYLDDQGHKIYKVLHYGDKVKMYVQTKNMAKTDVKLSVYLNLPTGNDALALAEKAYTVPDNELLIVDIDTNALKAKVAATDLNKIAMFYVVLKEADGDKFVYPKDLSLGQVLDTKKVNFYHHLKLSQDTDNINKQATANAPAVLGEPLETQGSSSSKCDCKQYNLIWGNKVSCEFRKKVVEIAANLGLPTKDYEGANWLMAVMALETGRTFSPTCGTFQKHNDDTRNGYVGLVQIGKDAALDLGVKRSELMKMTAEQQLDYVEKFLAPRKSKFKTKTDLYLAINYPSASGHGLEPNYVVYDSSKAAYDDNPSFKKEPDEFYIDKKGEKHFYKGKEGSSYVWEFEEEMNNLSKEGESNRAKIKRCKALISLNATDVITFHIYASGAIEKHTPKTISEEFKNKYKYIYHDQDEKEHVLGTFDYFKTTERLKGNKEGKQDTELLDARQFKGYSNPKVKLKFLTWNSDSQRWYINPECFAGLLGAMAVLNIDYLGFNGFSDNLARSVGGSSSHINGKKGDLRYLSTNKNGEATILQDTHFDYDKQVEFNNALYEFGWGIDEKMYSEYFLHDGKQTLLPHTKEMKKLGPGGYRHYHHLHLTGFDYAAIIKVTK